MKYFDAFGEGGFHSAFFTTYAFSPLAFEDVPFPKLRGAGCRNIVVLADQAMVNQAFGDFGPARFAGSSYHLVKVKAGGAFHPKIAMLLGHDKGRLMVGSANLTALGLGGNKEQVATLRYSADQPEHARHFLSVLAYLRSHVPADDPWFTVSLERALRSAPWLRANGLESGFASTGEEEVNLLLDRPDIDLLGQLEQCLGSDPIARLIVVSPYWDKELEGLVRLRSSLGNPPTDLLIQSDANGFPSARLSRFAGVELFDAAENADGRFLHAKLIIAQGRDWDHVVSGSMNCTFPALLGPSVGGNAEAAIYKRVPAGTALGSLGLADYSGEPLGAEELNALEAEFTPEDVREGPPDGGTLILQSDTLIWTPPRGMARQPISLALHDRDAAPLEELAVHPDHRSWAVDTASGRPKFAVVLFADEARSAPVQIADMDLLSVTTLPPSKGRKKQLLDTFTAAMHEDLILIETLGQLEALETAEGDGTPLHLPRTAPTEKSEETRTYEVLSYEDYIRARTAANAKGAVFETSLGSRRERGSNLISTCLNRLIGLVGIDLGEAEESDLRAIGSIDLKTTEPGAAAGEERGEVPSRRDDGSPRRIAQGQSKATARKFQEAVSSFETRCKAMQGSSINTSEIVRLRALIQIILAHAQPISGDRSPGQILPVYTAEGHDWPRLIGRLLIQHFGASRALQDLEVEPDDSEQLRVIEYLALANWAGAAAHRAVLSIPRARSLVGPLTGLLATLRAQTEAILSAVPADKTYFDTICAKLDERFAARLGLEGRG